MLASSDVVVVAVARRGDMAGSVSEGIRALAAEAEEAGVRPGVVGGDVLLTDGQGNSFIGGADFATEIVDEIERPAHRRARFTVAY